MPIEQQKENAGHQGHYGDEPAGGKTRGILLTLRHLGWGGVCHGFSSCLVRDERRYGVCCRYLSWHSSDACYGENAPE